MNELLFFISILIIFSIIVLIKKFFVYIGLVSYISVAIILANIFTCKSINLFGFECTLGGILFSSIFLSTDIITECYGIKEAKKSVLFGFVSSLFFILLTQIAMAYSPNQNDFAQPAFKTLFSITPRITFSSLIMCIVSNYIDVNLYNYLKNKMNNKHLWFRNNISTILCNCMENFLFFLMAFYNIYDINVILNITLTTSIIEIIIALCDTPFLYLIKFLDKNNTFEKEEQNENI